MVPAGDRIATGHDDGIVRVWDAATGKLIWHKALTPVLRATGGISEPVLRGVLRRRPAADRGGTCATIRIDESDGIVAIYDAASGVLVRAIPGRGSKARCRRPTAG